MPNIKVYDKSAIVKGSMELSDKVFGCEYNGALIHEVVVAYLANQRQGNKSTLTRSEVRGHAKKPWAQKHTGHARHGSTKAPQWTGGGVAFAPKPRDFSKKVNAKAKQAAFRSAISQKLAQNELTVVDNLTLDAAKTKEAVKVIDAFKFTGRTLFVVADENESLRIATNNIPNVDVVNASLVNTYEVVVNKNVVATEDAIKKLEEAYAK